MEVDREVKLDKLFLLCFSHNLVLERFTESTLLIVTLQWQFFSICFSNLKNKYFQNCKRVSWQETKLWLLILCETLSLHSTEINQPRANHAQKVYIFVQRLSYKHDKNTRIGIVHWILCTIPLCTLW